MQQKQPKPFICSCTAFLEAFLVAPANRIALLVIVAQAGTQRAVFLACVKTSEKAPNQRGLRVARSIKDRALSIT